MQSLNEKAKNIFCFYQKKIKIFCKTEGKFKILKNNVKKKFLKYKKNFLILKVKIRLKKII